MSRISDVPSSLGEYMLKGWVLTDVPCPTEGCIIPLLRSRDHTVEFCAKCDGSPEVAARHLSQPAASQTLLPSPAPGPAPGSSAPSAPASLHSPHSTPPTSPASAASSLPSLPAPTPLTLARRAQSDLASQRIGERLLKGWAMLGEECPRDECYGVPLVRKPGKGPGGQGECVICGWGSDEPRPPVVQPQQAPPAPLPAPVAASIPTQSAPRLLGPKQSSAPPIASVSPDFTKPIAALNAAIESLSDRLHLLSSNPALTDPSLIKNTAEAMTAVLEALVKTKAVAGQV